VIERKKGKERRKVKVFFLVLSKNAKFFIPLVSLVLVSRKTFFFSRDSRKDPKKIREEFVCSL